MAPKNRIGTSLVRKKCRTSEMFLSRRRGCADPEAKAASVPTLTSGGLDALAMRAVVRFAGTDLPAAVVAVFFAAAFLATFVGRLDRTGRSLIESTSFLVG